MKKLLFRLFFIFLFLFAQLTNGQNYTPLVITSGFNEDVIAEANPASNYTSSAVDAISSGSNNAFMSIDYSNATVGLPSNGLINSIASVTPGLTFQLQPYNQNNSLRLVTSNSTGTFTVQPTNALSKLYILATSGNSSSNFTGGIYFTDGTIQSFETLYIPDWYYSGSFPVAISGIGRVSRAGTQEPDNNNFNPKIFQVAIDIDLANQNKIVHQVVIRKISAASGYLNIFALSGEIAPTCFKPLDVIVNSTSSNSAVFSWTDSAVVPAIGYEFDVRTSGNPGEAIGRIATGTTDAGVLTATVNELQPGSNYKFYVRALCSETDSSTWTEGKRFITLCQSPTIVSSTGGLICESGTTTLHANYDSGITRWYETATSNNVIGTGNTFNTPQIAQTTSFWVSAISEGSIQGNVGKSAPVSSFYYTDTDTGIVFDVLSPTRITSADIYAITGGTITIKITDSSGEELYATDTLTIHGNNINAPNRVPLDYQILPGTGYRMLIKSYSGVTLIRESSGNTYPYTNSDDIINITSGYFLGNSTSYYYFYNIGYETGCSSTRTEVIAYIQDTPAPTANDQEFCSSEAKTVGDLVINGTDVKWYASATSTTELDATDLLVSGTYFATQTLNGCESTTRTAIEVTIFDTPAPTATDQEFCSSEAKTVGDLVINGTDVKWYASATATTELDATQTLVSGTYYATQTINNCESTTRTAIEVTISDTPAPTANNQNYCISEAKTVGDLVINGTDVKWYASATSTTELDATELLVSGTYFATQTINNCESTTRTAIEVTIFDTPAPTADNQEFCISEAKTVGDLIVVGTDVKWYASATTTELDATDLLVSGTYYATQTINNCESTTRTAIEVTIFDTPAPTANNQNYCISEAKTVGDLVINGTDVKWYASATSTTELDATDLLVSGTYFATQTLNGCESTTRTAIEVTIFDTPAPTATDQEFCSSEAKTVGDLVINGTDVKWYASATATTELDATEILVSGTYYATQTINNCESTTRTAIEVTIFDTPAPTATDQEFCSSEAKTVGDLVINGTDVKWYASATATTELDATELLVSGTYYATQTINNCESTTRTAIEVTIFDTPAPTATNQNYCISEAKTVGDLVINGTDVKWYASATSTTELDATEILVSGTYYATQTINNCESTTRTAIEVTIFDTPAPTADNQNYCISEAKTVGDLVINGTDVKWYASATATTELDATQTLVSGTYYATQTINNCESTTRTAIEVTIFDTPAPTANNQNYCISEAKTVGDLVINGTDVKWYASATATTELDATEILVSGTYFATQTLNGCESTTRTAIEVTIFDTPAPTADNQNYCISEAKTVGDLVINGTDVKWYASATATTELDATEILVSGTYFATQTLNGCESTTRTAIEVTIFDTPAPTADNQNYCISEAKTVGDLVINGTDVKWYASATATTELDATEILVSGTYYATQTINNCESTTRTAIEVTIFDTPAPTATDQEFCSSEAKTVGDLVINGTDVKWYASATATTELDATEMLVSGTYYATQTINNCESTSRTAIEVVINETPIPTGTNAISFCSSEFATLDQINIVGENIQWYVSPTSTQPLDNTTIVQSQIYYATQTINGCESVMRKSVNVTVIPIQTISTQTVYVCTQTLLQNVIIDGLTFNHLKWYSSIDSSNVLPGSTMIHSTMSLYVETNNGICTSDRVLVTIETLPIVPQPAVANVIYICGSGTVGDLAASGASNGVIEWFSSLGSTTPLSANALLMNGTYYVSQRIGDCISSKKAVAVVVVSQTAPLLNNLEVCEGTKINDVEWFLPSGSVYEWYSSPNAHNPLTTDFVLTTGTYYIGRNTNGCKSNRTIVNVTVNSIPNAPTGQSIQEIVQPATINDIVMDQNNIIWFSTYNNALTQTYALSPTSYLVSGATYYGIIQNDSGCYSLPTAVTVNLFLGINDLDKSHLLVYPNPTTDKLFIEYNEIIDRVEVYSILGQKLVELTNNNNNVEVDMTTLSNGTYMIKIVVGNNSQLIKAIKK